MQNPTLVAPSFHNTLPNAAVESYADAAALVELHAGMVRNVARRIFHRLPPHLRGFDEDDLYSVGMIGLLDAASRYEPQPGVNFEAFAEYRVKGAILDEVRRNDFFPRRLRAKANKVRKAQAKLEAELGRAPSNQEIADELGMELGSFETLQGKIAPYHYVEHDSPALVLESSSPDPHSIVEEQQRTVRIAQILEELPERERTVLDLYFNKELKLREIADLMDLTEGRISQIKSAAINLARKRFAEAGIAPN